MQASKLFASRRLKGNKQPAPRSRPEMIEGLEGRILFAGAPDSKGTDFWLAFPENYQAGATLKLFITGDTNTTGTVTAPGTGFSAPVTVTAGAVTTIDLPSTLQLSGSNSTENKGIHVTSQDEVTVYGLNRIQFSTDAYLGLPTDILGTDYLALGYETASGYEFAVVATQNNTTVTVTPIVAAGGPRTIVLNQGQTYQSINYDRSGTSIQSDKPIAVFGGSKIANVPATAVAADHLVEQMTPTTTWGKNFVTMPLATRLLGDTFRFLASTNNTTVKVNGATVATLNRGQFFEQIVTGPAQITADQPILVAQYSNGSSFDGVTSDPFEMLISPYEQFLNGYTVTTPATGFTKNFINVVAPTAAVGSITLDGVAIPAASFTPIGSSGFSGAQLAVALGAHNLGGSALPFGTFVYGFDAFDSYGYPGGLSLAPIASATNLSLTPASGSAAIGSTRAFNALVTDQNNLPLEGIRVDFAVTGANATTGFANTNAAGVATFNLVGTNAGTDTVTAVSGSLTDTATVTWQDNVPPPPSPTEFSINDVVQLEGSGGGKTAFTFTILRSGDVSGTSTVEWKTEAQTAKGGSDYDFVYPTLLTFAPNEAIKTVTVLVNADKSDEGTETFLLRLLNPTNAALADETGRGEIRNDDGPPRFNIDDVSKTEGNSGNLTYVFTVTLDRAATQTTSVKYQTANGSANSSDYLAKSGTLTFAAGQKTKTISITVKGDKNKEIDETFFVNLFNPTGGALIGDGQGRGTIRNND